MITAKEAFALSKDKITVRETLNKIGTLIETIAKNGECKMWYKLCSFHLKHMIDDIARKPGMEIDLRESCLKDLSPADVCELLEEMGWRESDCLIDRHWSVITMWSHQWSFALCVSFNGYEGSLCLRAGEKE